VAKRKHHAIINIGIEITAANGENNGGGSESNNGISSIGISVMAASMAINAAAMWQSMVSYQ